MLGRKHQQQCEINYLLKHKEVILEKAELCPMLIQCFEKLTVSNNKHKSLLDEFIALQVKEDILNQINAAIIRNKIDLESLDLNCSNCHLTRFPGSLITDPTLQDYWSTIQVLLLDDNQLVELPAEIGQLLALESLILSNNKLTTLPAEIEKLVALDWMLIDHNPLCDTLID